jgi:hypothetical protein
LGLSCSVSDKLDTSDASDRLGDRSLFLPFTPAIVSKGLKTDNVISKRSTGTPSTTRNRLTDYLTRCHRLQQSWGTSVAGWMRVKRKKCWYVVKSNIYEGVGSLTDTLSRRRIRRDKRVKAPAILVYNRTSVFDRPLPKIYHISLKYFCDDTPAKEPSIRGRTNVRQTLLEYDERQDLGGRLW